MRESERFQTMLGGAENRMVRAPTDSADRDISGLREGSYDFKVRLVTDSGEAGEAAPSLHFDIAPPWWRTPLARVAFAGSRARSSIIALVRLRTRSLKRRATLLEKMVRQRTEELQKANAAKTEFVASMSHEIRNPMGGILASALELSESPLAPEQERLVTTHPELRHVPRLARRGRARLCGHRGRAPTRWPCPASARGRCWTTWSRCLSRGRRDARMDGRGRPGAAREHRRRRGPDPAGDRQLRRQLDQVRRQEHQPVRAPGRTATLSSRSPTTASGIPAEEQKNLFIRFSRLKSARNSAIPGSGLGLAVSRALAERMGGSVGVDDAPGRGSTFFLRIPLEAARGRPRMPRNSGARGAAPSSWRTSTTTPGRSASCWEGLGFEVEFAVDGDEALRRLASAAYDAVFLDCDMPKGQRNRGGEALPRLRSRGAAHASSSPQRPFRRSDQDACMAAGMDAFLAKPITPGKAPPSSRRTADAIGLPKPSAGESADQGTQAGPDRGTWPTGRRKPSEGELAAFTRLARRGGARGRPGPGASGSRPAVSSAAHRVLSLARMVGAGRLAATAADLQEYACAYTESELEKEIALLDRQAGELRNALGARATLAGTGLTLGGPSKRGAAASILLRLPEFLVVLLLKRVDFGDDLDRVVILAGRQRVRKLGELSPACPGCPALKSSTNLACWSAGRSAAFSGVNSRASLAAACIVASS